MTTPFGILNVDKPAGLTSRDAVDRVERLVRPAKCGHAGTLDPLATGVLVVCVGRATRLIQYVQRLPKRYRGTFLLGQRSATDDTDGGVEIVSDAPQPTREAVAATLPGFVGDVEQRPPAHSAIKIGGRRAYDLARQGELVELPPRTVTVHSLEIRRYEYPELELEIACGGGTYVRALGRDLAAALGTSAVMSALVRTAIGEFRIEEAVPLDELTAENVRSHVQPALSAVAHLPRVELGDRELTQLRFGRPIAKPKSVSQKAEAVSPGVEWAGVGGAGELTAILVEKYPGQLWPALNFMT